MKESAANDPDSIQFFIFGGLFVLAFLWIVIGFAIMLWKRKKSGVVFPKPSDPEVIFSANFASALQNDPSALRRKASNCLTVLVTNTHLVITTFFPFTAIVKQCGLEHFIPIHNVLKATLDQRIVDLEFIQKDNSLRKISLHLKNPEVFLRAIESSKNN